MNLDISYGRVIHPEPSSDRPDGYWQWESELTPISYSILSSETAKPLKDFMDHVTASWKLGDVLTYKVTIIYLVDTNGFVRLAIEEAVSENVEMDTKLYLSLRIPYLRKLLRTDKRLGHPSLVRCGSSRIAGQILFQPPVNDSDLGHWEIDAWSGRYGRPVRSAARTSEQLQNVIKIFENFGIRLVNAYGLELE